MNQMITNLENPYDDSDSRKIGGRECKINQLVDYLKLAVPPAKAWPVLVYGKEGVGKTTLLKAFKNRAAEKTGRVTVEVNFADSGNPADASAMFKDLNESLRKELSPPQKHRRWYSRWQKHRLRYMVSVLVLLILLGGMLLIPYGSAIFKSIAVSVLSVPAFITLIGLLASVSEPVSKRWQEWSSPKKQTKRLLKKLQKQGEIAEGVNKDTKHGILLILEHVFGLLAAPGQVPDHLDNIHKEFITQLKDVIRNFTILLVIECNYQGTSQDAEAHNERDLKLNLIELVWLTKCQMKAALSIPLASVHQITFPDRMLQLAVDSIETSFDSSMEISDDNMGSSEQVQLKGSTMFKAYKKLPDISREHLISAFNIEEHMIPAATDQEGERDAARVEMESNDPDLKRKLDTLVEGSKKGTNRVQLSQLKYLWAACKLGPGRVTIAKLHAELNTIRRRKGQKEEFNNQDYSRFKTSLTKVKIIPRESKFVIVTHQLKRLMTQVRKDFEEDLDDFMEIAGRD